MLGMFIITKSEEHFDFKKLSLYEDTHSQGQQIFSASPQL